MSDDALLWAVLALAWCALAAVAVFMAAAVVVIVRDWGRCGTEAVDMEERFCMVWAEAGNTPSVKHSTPMAAIEEATRLATKTGRKVYVLEVIGFAKPPQAPSAEWHGLTEATQGERV